MRKLAKNEFYVLKIYFQILITADETEQVEPLFLH